MIPANDASIAPATAIRTGDPSHFTIIQTPSAINIIDAPSITPTRKRQFRIPDFKPSHLLFVGQSCPRTDRLPTAIPLPTRFAYGHPIRGRTSSLKAETYTPQDMRSEPRYFKWRFFNCLALNQYILPYKTTKTSFRSYILISISRNLPFKTLSVTPKLVVRSYGSPCIESKTL